MRLFSTLTFVAVALVGSAQIVNVKSISKVELPDGITADRAVLSPSGDYVVAASLYDDGLNRINVADGSVSRITDSGSTLNLQISPDGSKVAFRKAQYDANHRRMVSVEQYDFNTDKASMLVAPSRNLQGFMISDNATLSIENGKTRIQAHKGHESENRPVASIQYGALYITANGETYNISPQGAEGNSYLWPTVSPDGKKVAYYLATVGAYVCNIDGSNPVFIGQLRAPQWFGNDVVVGMTDLDDGTFVTSSKIVATRTDGTMSQILTDNSVRAMYPSVNTEGTEISFTTPEGYLYIINVNK